VDTVNPDIVMIYNDPIVVTQFLETIKNMPKTFKVWVYLDQVYEGCDQGLLRTIEHGADRIFCFTEKWKKYLHSRIPTTEKELCVLEHGVDTGIFKRLSDAERVAVRKQMNIPADATVFLNVNRNSERKRLDLSVMAFARLLQRNPELPLYLVFVTTMNPNSGAYYNPVTIFVNELKSLDLDVLKYGQRVLCVDTAPPKMLDDKTIASIYNACDYGVNTSNGEGFGLCQLEHLACGAPQVVINSGDYEAFLTPDVAEIVQPSSYAYLPTSAGIGIISKSASAEEVAAAMHRIMDNKKVDACVQLAESRPWSRICDPFLEMVATFEKSA
jgi:glycosyltransferase involved in cell wall biosynthesis